MDCTKKMDASGKQKWRLVSDFRLLNEKTITDTYPLPGITQIIDQVGGHKYYTTLDLAKGFQQILMDPRDSQNSVQYPSRTLRIRPDDI